MRCKGSKLILLFKGLKGTASIPCDDLQPPNRHSRNQHPMAFKCHMLELTFKVSTARDVFYALFKQSELYSSEYDQGKVTYNDIYFQQKWLRPKSSSFFFPEIVTRRWQDWG